MRSVWVMVACAALVGGMAVTARPVAAAADTALLTLRDMPSGWATSDFGQVGTGSGKPFCGMPYAGPTLSDSGAVSVERSFERGSYGPFLYHRVTTMPPGWGPYGMDIMREVFRPCIGDAVGNDGSVAKAELSEMSFPVLGDDTLAIRLHMTDTTWDAQGDIIVIRQGDMLTMVYHVGLGFGPYTINTDLTERFARVAAGRLLFALVQP